MNLRSLNSSSMQGASFDREIASGFARKAISQDGEAVRSDSSAVAVNDGQQEAEMCVLLAGEPR